MEPGSRGQRNVNWNNRWNKRNLRTACYIIASFYLLEAVIQCAGFTKVHLACQIAGYCRRGGYTFPSKDALKLGHHWNAFSLTLLLYNILLNIFLIFGGLYRNACLCIIWLNGFSVVAIHWEFEILFCVAGSEFCKCMVTNESSTLFTIILLMMFFTVMGFYLYFTVVVYSYVHHLQHYWYDYQKKQLLRMSNNRQHINVQSRESV